MKGISGIVEEHEPHRLFEGTELFRMREAPDFTRADWLYGV